jgi:hypothetical protein
MREALALRDADLGGARGLTRAQESATTDGTPRLLLLDG